MEPVVVSARAAARFARVARRAAPGEACGTVVVRRGRVAWLIPARNHRRGPSFRMRPAAATPLLRALPGVDVAVWHSHPAGSCDLSRGDVEGAAGWGGLYLVTSAETSETRAYRIVGRGAIPVPVVR